MAEKSKWIALAQKMWPGAQLEGDGKHGVVVRCAGPHFTRVHLFLSWAEAQKFAGTPCGTACYRKHSQGNLEPYMPHPVARNVGANLLAYVESGD